MTSPNLPSPFTERRAEQLDALAAILPIEGRDRLSEILTDQDVATLTHLARKGIGPNSLRALASDLSYLETWALAATGRPLPWPASEALLLKFVAQHLWGTVKREVDPDHGMPESVLAALRARKIHAERWAGCGCHRATPDGELGNPAPLARS
jgi:hypothetical protein